MDSRLAGISCGVISTALSAQIDSTIVPPHSLVRTTREGYSPFFLSLSFSLSFSSMAIALASSPALTFGGVRAPGAPAPYVAAASERFPYGVAVPLVFAPDAPDAAGAGPAAAAAGTALAEGAGKEAFGPGEEGRLVPSEPARESRRASTPPPCNPTGRGEMESGDEGTWGENDWPGGAGPHGM
jgi:hypothetical protein